MSAFPDSDDLFSSDLISFAKSGNYYQSAAPAKGTPAGILCDFLSILGIAQTLKIDFLPITWQPALENVGHGGTAEIRQALVHLQMSFAFKRLIPAQSTTDETKSFRTLIAEISVLGHPLIRDHPNILKLEGICWDVVPDDEKVWPVLVFKKARHGDLQTFMEQAEGKRLSLEERLDLCADIATAVHDMHSNNIIHGDIKPANVLIFENDSNRYVAKVADFGYSSWFSSDDELIKMPRSLHWVAPEWHHQYFTTTSAKKMDTYSFSLLCLWLLFYNTHRNSTRNFYDNLDSAKTVLILAHQSITEIADLDDYKRRNLSRLFDLTLANNPAERSSDFSQLIRLLAPHRTLALHAPALSVSSSHSSYEDFQVMPSIYQLYLAHYEVRAYIATCLEKRATRSSSARVSQTAAFELALCYKLGFGIAKDDGKSESLLNQSMRQCKEFEYAIDQVKWNGLNPSFQEGIYKRLANQGHITGIDYAQYYREQQQLDKIELEYRREIADTRSVLGAEHKIVLFLESELSSVLDSQGRWKEAEELQVQVMETRKRVLGVKHPNTLTITANLASTYRHQGRWKEAESLEMQVMETSKIVLGVEHPDTLTSMANLAMTFSKQGQWKKAESLEIQVMETRKRVLGVEHPWTLASMGNLAPTYRYQGRWKEAELLEMQVMETRKRVLGVEHPDTLTSMAHLASTFWNQGRWKEAESLEIQVMETSKIVLGVEHPSTLTSMDNLAMTFWNQGRWKEAEELQANELQICERVLGVEHPDTLTCMGNLASTYGHQGRWKEAESLEIQVMETRKRVLGVEHPDTLTIMANLASTYGDQGQWKEAESLQMQVMEMKKKVLGVEHPDTLASIGKLASTYRNQGQLKEAESLEVQVMETSSRVSGPEHLCTLAAMINLAFTWKSQGRIGEAITLMEEYVERRTRTLGSDHPSTASAISTLNDWRVENLRLELLP